MNETPFISKYQNIFLVGLMGAGKSSVGRLISERLNKLFLDADAYLEEKAGLTIPQIFEEFGEDVFRQKECNAIDELTQLKNVVIATGGGAVVKPQNRFYLKQRGIVVYLSADVEVLCERALNDTKNKRPLLQHVDPIERFKQLFESRDSLYREIAHIVIDTNHLDINSIVNELASQINQL